MALNFTKLVDFIILSSPCLQMVGNLVTSPFELDMAIQSLSTSIQMNFFLKPDDAICNNVGKKGDHELGLSL